jgi:hypothetical protein
MNAPLGAAQSTEDAKRVAVCFCGANGGTVATGRRSSSDRFQPEFFRTPRHPIAGVLKASILDAVA